MKYSECYGTHIISHVYFYVYIEQLSPKNLYYKQNIFPGNKLHLNFQYFTSRERFTYNIKSLDLFIKFILTSKKCHNR